MGVSFVRVGDVRPRIPPGVIRRREQRHWHPGFPEPDIFRWWPHRPAVRESGRTGYPGRSGPDTVPEGARMLESVGLDDHAEETYRHLVSRSPASVSELADLLGTGERRVRRTL